MEHHDVVTSLTFAKQFGDKHHREWTKQDLIKFEKATEAYMVAIPANSYSEKQQYMSCRFSRCLQQL